MKITEAWKALGAAPKYARSWSSWSQDGKTLYITLPEPDIELDTRTIPLWRSEWSKTTNGRVRSTGVEQEHNLRTAIARGLPIRGFRVTLDAAEKHIIAAHPDRLLLMGLLIVDASNIIGQAQEPIKSR
jgi:hypothetical protein